MNFQTAGMVSKAKRKPGFAPAVVDYALAAGTVAMLAALIAALARGAGEWDTLPPVVWFHVVTIALTLVLTPVMLLRQRGDRRHRQLGYVWLAAMASTALASFGIRMINDGGFSGIHILSAVTLVGCGRAIQTARRHEWQKHRRTLRLIVGGALLLAGYFTFRFDRILGLWLMS